MESYQIADLFEAVADTVPDRDALVCGEGRLSYRELDERASRLAHFLASRGVGRGDHVGTYLYNGLEYVTTMLACFKISAVPININYRYVEEELLYLFRNADLKALVHHREFAPRIAAVKDDCPLLEHFVAVEDGSDADLAKLGSVPYEAALAAGSPERDFAGRRNDDLFIIYTGGTTGMPKGVMWAHEDAYFACFGGGNPVGEDITELEPLLERARTIGAITVSLIAAPLIHGAAQLATLIMLIGGGRLIYQKRFDADEIVELIAGEKVMTISLVGDAMARPIADALERAAAGSTPPDCSSLLVVGSAGAIFSEPVKDDLKRHLPQCTMLDNYGSTETGFQGSGAGGNHKSFGQGLSFQLNDRSVVLDDELRPVAPGSGVRGRVALRGHVPVGYYGDPEKSAEAFVTLDGVRHALTGDIAEVEADGAVKLYGRGSLCINSGGEKIFVEEVENALKRHPDVYDAVVVGLDDTRWGQRAVALVAPRSGAALPDEAGLQTHCRGLVAGYKVPKEIHAVAEIFRGPNGKADYLQAVRIATGRSEGRGAARDLIQARFLPQVPPGDPAPMRCCGSSATTGPIRPLPPCPLGRGPPVRASCRISSSHGTGKGFLMFWPTRTPAAYFALAALALGVLSAPALAVPFTTVSFTAPCSNCPDDAAWGDPASVSGSLTFDGDPTGGVTFFEADLVSWSVQIGTITFDQTNSSPSMLTTLPNTLVLDAGLSVVSAGVEFTLDGVPVDNTPYWMQLNKTASSLGVLEFSSFENGTLDNGNPSGSPSTIEFPYDGRAGVLSFSTGVVIPEPTSLALIGLGLAGLAGVGRARSAS